MNEALVWFIAAVPDDNDQDLLRRKYGPEIQKLYETSKAWSEKPQEAFTKALQKQLVELQQAAGRAHSP